MKLFALAHGTMYTGSNPEMIPAQRSADFNFNFPSAIGKMNAAKTQHRMENFYIKGKKLTKLFY